jgi:hypothetical protein
MALKGKPLLLTTSDQDVYVCPATQEASVHALVFSNLTAGAITISIKRYIQSTATTQQLVAALSVAANSTFNWPKPMNMAVGDKIIASASANSSIVCDYGAYENSATPAAVGFTGRGAWSSATAYVVNDVVTRNNNSYLAIQAGTNQDPATATAYWMLLAAQGAAGAVSSITAGSGLTGGTLNSGTPSGTFALDTSVAATLANAQTFTGTKSFTGSATALAMKITDAAEPATISATAATGTINFDITTQSILYYTTNASANFTINLRGNGTNTLNSLMATGDVVTVTFLNTNGSTAYYNTTVQVDGTTSGVTTRWQGAAPTAGNASSIDAYTYSIIKTANATFTVLASQSKFA